MLWFGLKNKIEDLEDSIDEMKGATMKIWDRLNGKDEDSVKILEQGGNIAIESLPDDPHALRRIYLARQWKNRLQRQEERSLEPMRPRTPRNYETETEPTEQSLSEQAKEMYQQANPLIKMFIGSEVKKRTGYDIQQVLADDNLLGQVINTALGGILGKVAEKVNGGNNGEQQGSEAVGQIGGSGGPLFVPSYDPRNPPKT